MGKSGILLLLLLADSHKVQIMVLDCIKSHYIPLDKTLLILSDNVVGEIKNKLWKQEKYKEYKVQNSRSKG